MSNKPQYKMVDYEYEMSRMEAEDYASASGARGYVERTKAEFDAVLVEKYKFHEIDLPGVSEVVYQRESTNGPFAVRVYSSLQKGSGRTRDCGEDAIRVTMVDLKTGRGRKIMGEKRNQKKSGKRINRTTGAMSNLDRRVRQYLIMGTENHLCPVCGGLMALRDGKYGKFLSCMSKNEKGEWCSGTRRQNEINKELLS